MNGAPSPVHVYSRAPVDVKVWLADASGREVPGQADVAARDSLVRWDGQLHCEAGGETVLTASYQDLSLEIPVFCNLVKRIRVREQVVLRPGEAFQLNPTVFDHDDQELEHPWNMAVDSPTVLSDQLVALAPGRAQVTTVAGGVEVRTSVLVGRPVLEQELTLGLDAAREFPMEPGDYVVLTEADTAAGVAFVTGGETCRGNGEALVIECTLETAGNLRVQNLTQNSAWKGRLVVLSLD